MNYKLVLTIGFAACALLTNGSYAKDKAPRVRLTVSPNFCGDLYDRLGVYLEDLSSARLGPGDRRKIEDEFMSDILRKGYTLAARSDLDRVQKELKLQASGITEEAVAREAHALSIRAMVVVTVDQADLSPYQPILAIQGVEYYTVTVSISARLISAERAEVVWIARSEAREHIRGRDAVSGVLLSVATAAAKTLPSRERCDD